jgi:hypothetical protein
MATKDKTFDCVRMKREAQEGLRADFEARRAEFASYAEFLKAVVSEAEWPARIWTDLLRAASPPTRGSSDGPPADHRRGA